MSQSQSQSQTQPSGENVGDLDDFKWGIHRGVGRKNKDIHYYESFFYEGVEYFLYDCAYFYHDDRLETSVGKLVQLYERPTHEKVVRVVWFFRPSEIRNFLGDYRPCWNELFLASGLGKGLSNINLVESIVGKCSVVCTSRDKRNPEPSETELKTTDFIFDRAFDVGTRQVVDKFADEIGGIEVGKFFNRKVTQKPSNPVQVGTNTRTKIVIKTRSLSSDLLHRQVEDNAEVRASENVVLKSSVLSLHKKRKITDDKPPIDQSSKSPEGKEFDEKGEKLRQNKRANTCLNIAKVTNGADGNDESSMQSSPHKKMKIVDERLTIGQSSKPPKDEDFDRKVAKFRLDKRVETCRKITEASQTTVRSDAGNIVDKKSTCSQSGKSLREEEFDESGAKLRHDKRVKTCGKVTEVTERPDAERRRWFKKLDWNKRLLEAQENGTLVLLNNLDPSYSSNDVEDLVWHALKKKVEARVIEQRLNSNNYYGRALVIFNTKDAAEFAIYELRRRCLILGDGRIVSAQKGTLIEPDKQRRFTGHIPVDKYAHQRRRVEMRNAVSTSHCSQNNNIEYDMAVEWVLQYKKSDACWEALHKKQMKEIEDVKSKLKKGRVFL